MDHTAAVQRTSTSVHAGDPWILIAPWYHPEPSLDEATYLTALLPLIDPAGDEIYFPATWKRGELICEQEDWLTGSLDLAGAPLLRCRRKLLSQCL